MFLIYSIKHSYTAFRWEPVTTEVCPGANANTNTINNQVNLGSRTDLGIVID